VWREEELAGGIYGLAIGSMFFGESMFGVQTDASKIALIALCKHLLKHGFGMMDCQVGNPHLFAMGAEELPRHRFESALRQLTESGPATSCWNPREKFDDRW
jgi:leucyl/phenylalanyl-tRNA--protein transferase